MEGALVGGLVAKVERELFVVFDGAFRIEAQTLQMNGTLPEPFVLRHAVDENLLGHAVGLVFVAETGLERFKFFPVFPTEKVETAGRGAVVRCNWSLRCHFQQIPFG